MESRWTRRILSDPEVFRAPEAEISMKAGINRSTPIVFTPEPERIIDLLEYLRQAYRTGKDLFTCWSCVGGWWGDEPKQLPVVVLPALKKVLT